ncbi:NK-lysin tandem duplicate 4 [Channa argus]|uniref:NK-lysin tandem duplicate 4 n=1 Tax=Channa argus TaxID=215402 RepID=UPI0029451241|nr:hypothetical protein Q8A73_017521 [Channa argus]
MEMSPVILVCMLVACSVWTVHGRSFQVNIDDQEQVDMETSMEAGKIPGMCWACKWAMNKVKKIIGKNATAESIKAKLLVVCNEIGLLKSSCRKFVNGHLGELIEEVTTTDDVRTICVNVKACKPKELFDLLIFSGNEDAQIIIN